MEKKVESTEKFLIFQMEEGESEIKIQEGLIEEIYIKKEIKEEIKIKEELIEDSLKIDVVDGIVHEEFTTHLSSDLEKSSEDLFTWPCSSEKVWTPVCKRIERYEAEVTSYSALDGNASEFKSRTNCGENSTKIRKLNLLEEKNSCSSNYGKFNDHTTQNLSIEEDKDCESFQLKTQEISHSMQENAKQDISFLSNKPVIGQMCETFPIAKKNLEKKLCDDESKLFGCEICNKSFIRKDHLKGHQIIHVDAKPFACEVCDKSFKSKGNLNRHIVCHSAEKPFVCEICSKSFNQKSHLDYHRLSHSEEKPFACEICDKSYRQKSHLNIHKLTHSDERPFVCEICEKTFKSKGELRQHMISHSIHKPFSCIICEKSFKSKDELRKHMITHSKEKPFSCENCEKKFKSKGEVRMHMISHSEEKPFKCGICEKSFKRRRPLEHHLISHSNGKPKLTANIQQVL